MSAARSTGVVVLLAALAASAPAQQPPAPPAAPPQAKPAFETQVITLEPAHAVVLPMKGSYAQHQEAFGRLGGFFAGRGVTAEAPFEVKELPATLAAVHVHRGPLEELGTAWPALIEWIISNGYQPVGPATQVFKGDLAVAPEVEMRMPVQK